MSSREREISESLVETREMQTFQNGGIVDVESVDEVWVTKLTPRAESVGLGAVGGEKSNFDNFRGCLLTFPIGMCLRVGSQNSWKKMLMKWPHWVRLLTLCVQGDGKVVLELNAENGA